MLLFSLLFLSLLAGTWPVSAEAPDIDACASCHAELEDEELAAPTGHLDQDVHRRRGLSCADCHGGDAASEDPDESMDEDNGFLGVPTKEEIPGLCGRCHSDASYIRRFNPALRVDQVTLFRTSVHGQRLAGAGDQKVAACADCHGAHGILPGNDPRSPVYAANVPQTCGRCHSDPVYMREYGIPTDQYEKYRKSVHGRPLLEEGDTAAPACNDCHGNHGATPPGVSSLANVCGQCHPINNNLVNQSPHRTAFEKLGLAACETCHSHHGIEVPGDAMVGGEAPAVCANCHRPDKWPKGWAGARAIRAALDSLVERHRKAEVTIRRAERAGMEVGEALFDLNEVAGRLTKTRSVLHSFDPEKVREVSDEGTELATKAERAGHAALAELQFRRRGLGLSLVVIVVLGVGLVIKIRGLNHNQAEEMKR